MSDNPFTYDNGFIPDVVASNVLNKTTKQNRFINSGIVVNSDPIANNSLLTPSHYVIIPYTNDLGGSPETWTDDKKISVANLGSGKQRMFKFFQDKAYGWTDKSQEFTTSNPRDVVNSRFANWWTGVDEDTVIKELGGVFDNGKIATAHKFVDSKAGALFNARGFLATLSKFGDLQDSSTNNIVVNSAVYSEMKAQNMLDNPNNQVPQNQVVNPFGTYNGMKIIVDDSIPLNPDGTSTSYICANGAITYAVANPENAVAVQREELEMGGRTTVVNRRVTTTHINGTTVADNFTPSGSEPSVDDVVKGSTWDCVVDPRNIGVVAYEAKVSDDFNPFKSQSTGNSNVQINPSDDQNKSSNNGKPASNQNGTNNQKQSSDDSKSTSGKQTGQSQSSDSKK
ncbi:hypothetical protein DY120_07275 [Apilactobacillus micheneri]|uniref:Uncharacterized protein n=1 Tax=Apilactobacillus micheneri TaxID=1899430 RepID=A0ABY2YUZ1_9LACO|nr:hypothetical protein [Apilactobacillus micheneri]TPR23099.1 hypothetical protein DY114_07260 [Apilactobacillus micheneri]TPR24417.1 hypothetical protein DY111_07275 [Apilactobacillus micheneri]TPR29364.1 hypothetical protein DY120_07275 [Apilactobacillus micheneri]TPR34571.1 hypothetical protein DY027_07265 [Apilactobacillus micheneri]